MVPVRVARVSYRGDAGDARARLGFGVCANRSELAARCEERGAS